MSTTTLQVRKDKLAETRLVTTDDAPLATGQARVRVDSFALTANNITYAAFGDAMNYWRFYPAPEEGWGIVPVWGFATVVQSLHPGVAVGERLYGYWPMAGSSVLQPDKLSESGFREGAAHRAELHPLYNQVVRASADPLYTADSEDVQSLLRPLFVTSWLIDDLLADNDFFGARRILLSSASSKTAYGTAFQLHQRPGLEVVGLTSPGNQAFCERLGCYHRVLTYDALDQLEADVPCVYVDFAGDAPLRRRIHERFSQLKYSCSVGATHVDDLGGAKDLPGPRATLFFAPAQAKKRQGDWGPGELGRRLGEAWHAFRRKVQEGPTPWLLVRSHAGAAEVQAAYAALLAGRADPAEGHVLSFHAAAHAR
jgi:hypothetical protein